MSIIFFTRLFYPHIGGVERHVFAISRCLIGIGHEVTVVTEQFNSSLPLSETVDGIKIIRIPISHGKNKKFQIWKWMNGSKELFKDADILHFHDVYFWFFPLKPFFPFKKTFITFHGYEGVFPPERKAVAIRKLSERMSNGVICVGNYIEKWYGTKADVVIFGGIEDKNIKSNKSNNNSLKIAFLGRFEADIGVETYVRVLNLLKNQKVKFYFLALGQGSLEEKLQKFGKTKLLSDPTSEIQKADIVFVSSYLGIFESLAQKKLVISTYDNSLKEDYLKMTPFQKTIIIEKDPLEIVKKILEFQKSPKKYQSMIQKGYKYVKTQSWEHVAKKYLKLWTKK